MTIDGTVFVEKFRHNLYRVGLSLSRDVSHFSHIGAIQFSQILTNRLNKAKIAISSI